MKKVSQISMKALGYTPKEVRSLVDGKNEAIFLGRIGGVAVETFNGEGKHGQWHGFKGSFIGVNEKGEQYSANAAFFPTNITNKLLEQFENGLVEIDVKADVYGIATDKNASGYAYMCEPVMSVETCTKIEKMQAELFSDLPVRLAIENNPAKNKAA